MQTKSVWRVRGTLMRFEAEGSPQYEVLFEAYFPDRDSAHAVYHKGEREYGLAAGHRMRWELEGFYFGNNPHSYAIEQMFEDVRNELEG